MLLGILLSLLIFVCVCLVAVILLQRSEGGALGMGGGGGGGGFMSARGTADLLTRTTQILGFIFFVLCLTITVVTGRTQGTGSVVDLESIGKVDPNSLKKAPAPTDPSGGFQAPLPSIGGQPAPAPQDFPVQPGAPLGNSAPAQ